ncbi:MAG TPA: aldehyde dehydrogenase family protein [Candidatus Xenobia bacterium]|jgi:aldehyde dehydrogenase (NAD+)
MLKTEVQSRQNLIDGKFVDAQSQATFESRSPAHKHEVVGVFPRSGADDVDRAVKAARQAFKSWHKVPAPKRAELLYRAAAIITRRKEEMAQALTREMGKVLKEARGDVQEAIDMTLFVAGEGRRMHGETTPSELPNKFAMSVRQPLGVVAAITPWNFPVAIPSWKLMPALLAGNTVVFKPATDTPNCGQLFIEVLVEAGVPAGVVNLVHGSGSEVGHALLTHPDINLISFTGSTETGREVLRQCGDRNRKSTVELGGKNAIMVMDDADLDLAVEGAVWGAFGTSGQRCTSSSRLVVHRKVVDAFTTKLVARAKALRLGDGLLETTEVGPVINQAALEKIHRYTEIGQAEGARLMCGGEVESGGACADGTYYRPTVFADVKPSMRIAQEEIFGPTTVVIPVDSLDEAVEVTNGVAYGLSAAIYTQNVNQAFAALAEVNTGLFYVNASTIGAEVQLPFGGTKCTGNGHREAGTPVLDIYTEWKACYIDYSGRLQKAQIDT